MAAVMVATSMQANPMVLILQFMQTTMQQQRAADEGDTRISRDIKLKKN